MPSRTSIKVAVEGAILLMLQISGNVGAHSWQADSPLPQIIQTLEYIPKLYTVLYVNSEDLHAPK